MKLEELPALIAMVILLALGAFAFGASIIQGDNLRLMLAGLLAILVALYIGQAQTQTR